MHTHKDGGTGRKSHRLTPPHDHQRFSPGANGTDARLVVGVLRKDRVKTQLYFFKKSFWDTLSCLFPGRRVLRPPFNIISGNLQKSLLVGNATLVGEGRGFACERNLHPSALLRDRVVLPEVVIFPIVKKDGHYSW